MGKFFNRGNHMRKFLLPVAGLVLLATSNVAFAASSNSSFNVKVAVVAACTVSAADMDFGSFTGNITATTKTTNATVSCNKNTSYALSLSSTAATGTATATMLNGAASIPASLTVSTTSQTATGGSDTTTISGSIAAVTNPAIGSYTVAQSIYVFY